MKKLTWIPLALALAILVSGAPSLYAQQQEPAPPAQQDQWRCPWMGKGPMMGRGPGMGRGFGRGWCMKGGGPMAGINRGEPVTREQATLMLENYVRYTNNPNLKLGDVVDRQDFFEGSIVTKKEGALVEKIQVDKKGGWFRNAS